MKPGDRIMLRAMPDEPDPLPLGATGTVQRVRSISGEYDQVDVAWDAPHEHRTLSLVIPPDRVQVIP